MDVKGIKFIRQKPMPQIFLSWYLSLAPEELAERQCP